MYHVYILFSHTCGKRYVGQTDDLDRRISQHNDPEYTGSKYTKRFPGPWILIHSETFATRSEAMKREKWFKTGIGRSWMDDHIVIPDPSM